LEISLHVSGGVVVGTKSLRDRIFRRELPLTLEEIRYGDRDFFDTPPPGFDATIIVVHFRSSDPRYDRWEEWGTPSDYS
jgi:hypothetical protein